MSSSSQEQQKALLSPPIKKAKTKKKKVVVVAAAAAAAAKKKKKSGPASTTAPTTPPAVGGQSNVQIGSLFGIPVAMPANTSGTPKKRSYVRKTPLVNKKSPGPGKGKGKAKTTNAKAPKTTPLKSPAKPTKGKGKKALNIDLSEQLEAVSAAADVSESFAISPANGSNKRGRKKGVKNKPKDLQVSPRPLPKSKIFSNFNNKFLKLN